MGALFLVKHQGKAGSCLHNKHFPRYCILLFVMMAFISCEFQPSSIPEASVEEPSATAPEIEIEITPDTDTLKLYDATTITYGFYASPRQVHWVQFLWDGEELETREYGAGIPAQITFDPDPYSEGLHLFEIRVFTSTNSGSIGDAVGAEGYLYQLQWPAVIDRTPLRKLNILSVEPVEGGAIVKWEKFPHPAFSFYRLEKLGYFDGRNLELALIDDQDVTEFFDTDYLEGDNVVYNVFLNGTPGYSYEISEPPGQIEATWLDTYAASVSWTPTLNPDRLDYYRVFLNDKIAPKEVQQVPYQEDQPPFVYDSLGFGSGVTFNVQFIPKTSSTNYSYGVLGVASAKIATGEKIPEHELAKKIPGTSKSLLNDGNKLVLFDHETRKSLDSINSDPLRLRAFRIAPDGQIVYTLVGNEFEAWEIDGFNSIGKINLNEIDSRLSSLYDISVSSNGRILFVTAGGHLLLYDFQAEETLYKSEDEVGWGAISPDGENILARYTGDSTEFRYYSLVGGQLNLIGKKVYPVKLWPNTFFFSAPEHNQLITCLNNELQVRDAGDFSLINEIQLPYNGFITYDPESHRLLYAAETGARSTKCCLISLPRGEITDTVFLSARNILLHNRFLVGRNGRQLNLDELK